AHSKPQNVKDDQKIDSYRDTQTTGSIDKVVPSAKGDQQLHLDQSVQATSRSRTVVRNAATRRNQLNIKNVQKLNLDENAHSSGDSHTVLSALRTTSTFHDVKNQQEGKDDKNIPTSSIGEPNSKPDSVTLKKLLDGSHQKFPQSKNQQ